MIRSNIPRVSKPLIRTTTSSTKRNISTTPFKMPLFYTPVRHHNQQLDNLFNFCAPAANGNEFDNFFKLIDSSFKAPQHVRKFNPTFDVKETETAYELQGELPGVEQKDVSVEFVDPTTLVIKGRREHQYKAGTPPKAAVEATPAEAEPKAVENAPASGYKSPSIEDENEDGTTTPVSTTEAKGKEVESATPAEPEQKQPEDRYWISERSYGEFQRSFSFPATINTESVRASLKNGILKIVVPKREDLGAKRIEIQ